MKSALVALALLATAGCATASPKTDAKAPFPERRQPFDPARFSARYSYPLECEAMARQLQAYSQDHAWAALRACVAQGHFWALSALLTPTWIPDILHRKGAPELITRVIAARGGDVAKDLQILHRKKIPVFSLSDAIASPRLYQGRMVMLRAEVTGVTQQSSGLVAHLTEVALTSEEGEPRQVSETSELRFSHQATPLPHSPAPEGPQMRDTATQTHRWTVPVWKNVSIPTGNHAVATVGTPDPFFEPGSELVLLAKFEGLEPSEKPSDEPAHLAMRRGRSPKPVPKLEILGYAHPSKLVLR